MTQSPMTPQDLRLQAANDYAWAETRRGQYVNDGASIPEPIKRLSALAFAVTEQPDGGVTLTARVAQDTTDAHQRGADALSEIKLIRQGVGAIDGETTADAVKRVMAVVHQQSRLALEDTGVVILRVAARLAGEDLTDLLRKIINAHTYIQASTQLSASADPCASIVSVVQEKPARDLIKLQHGLVLENISDSRRVIFGRCNPVDNTGSWFVFTIVHNGDGTFDHGSETSTSDAIWYSDSWKVIMTGPEMLPGGSMARAKLEPAKQKKEEVLPSSSPVTTTKIKVADWNPDPATLQGYVDSMKEALAKAGIKVEVTPELVASMVAKFKVEKGASEVTKPGTAFFHTAMSWLKGK